MMRDRLAHQVSQHKNLRASVPAEFISGFYVKSSTRDYQPIRAPCSTLRAKEYILRQWQVLLINQKSEAIYCFSKISVHDICWLMKINTLSYAHRTRRGEASN
jgi:hypothetical protein